ncbi:LysR substrate-binding domain-containing protein [Variovorax sp. tm]|uniref:LysR substrate-binding domain-containing protein n=1 Tax=Variovorax atrisoli TaxID=3394203 RepID=UPI003A7F700A
MLPSLNMLRAFEAAGRLGGVTKAAAELHVTQSAVSHQIKQLERWLGVKLVTRQGRELALTSVGTAYLPRLSEAFLLMAEATADVTRAAARPRLTVNALPTVAAQWLIPRLGEFCRLMPEVDVQILTTAGATDFDPKGFDVSVRCLAESEFEQAKERPRWQGLRMSRFLPEATTPLCSPGYARQARVSTDPASLRECTLIHTRSSPGLWDRWFALARVRDNLAAGQLVFDHTHQAIQAAIQGLGVALGSPAFSAEAISAGLLCAPFPHQELADKHYCWIASPNERNRELVEGFCEWLDAEGALKVPRAQI